MNNYERWNKAWLDLGLPIPDPSLFKYLMDCYAEQHRAYHTLTHIHECLTAFDTARQLAEHPAEIELAIWYHDVIYDVRRSDNEEQSAELAGRNLLEAGASSIVATRVSDLILVTQHNTTPLSADAALMVDVDLSILGAVSDRFWEYERQIRAEYSWVPLKTFQSIRAKLLRSLLARPLIYTTIAFVKFEHRARSNLSASLKLLEA